MPSRCRCCIPGMDSQAALRVHAGPCPCNAFMQVHPSMLPAFTDHMLFYGNVLLQPCEVLLRWSAPCRVYFSRAFAALVKPCGGLHHAVSTSLALSQHW